MDPFYQNPSPCFPPLQADHGDLISSLTYSASSCSASSFVHSFNLNHKIEGMEEHQDQVLNHDYKQEDDQLSLSRNTYGEDHQTQIINHSNSFKPLIHESRGYGVVDGGKQCNSTGLHVKWMSSKMRLMKKMLSTEHKTASRSVFTNNEHASRIRQRSPVQDRDDSSGNSPNKIRVCSDCSTTKTPLWRSGPQGPKSLCNACGIRQRKARRAMAAAAANGGLLIKEKRPGCTGTSDHKMTQYKKRCKLGSQRSKKKINFEEFKMSLSKSSAFQQVFPQEYEIKEAAILLMALSCGLVQG